jgi:hypothetical protein
MIGQHVLFCLLRKEKKMNQITLKSLSLYRQILKSANTMTPINSDRSRRVSDLFQDELFCDYIVDNARKHFRSTQRQFQSNKLDSDNMMKRLTDAQWVVHGLQCVIRDATQPTHKRKNIKQSPHINILSTAVVGNGNSQFHDALLDAFIVAAKFDYEYNNNNNNNSKH